jgi:hypothetical protein
MGEGGARGRVERDWKERKAKVINAGGGAKKKGSPKEKRGQQEKKRTISSENLVPTVRPEAHVFPRELGDGLWRPAAPGRVPEDRQFVGEGPRALTVALERLHGRFRGDVVEDDGGLVDKLDDRRATLHEF